jgi:hypothetical protein
MASAGQPRAPTDAGKRANGHDMPRSPTGSGALGGISWPDSPRRIPAARTDCRLPLSSIQYQLSLLLCTKARHGLT